MPTIITLIIIVLFIVLLAWMWNNLGGIDKRIKIPIMVGGLVVTWIMTFVIYKFSQIGVEYESKEVMKTIQGMFVTLFTIINGYVLLPYTFRQLNKIDNNEIKNEEIKKRIKVLVILFLVLAIIESRYLSNAQNGILELIKR